MVPGAESNHRHEDFQSKSLRVYGRVSWRNLTVLFLRLSLWGPTRTYLEIEFPNLNPESALLIRESEHTQWVSRIELQPNIEPLDFYLPNVTSQRLCRAGL